MPIYTYRCPHCGAVFEEKQTFFEPPVQICPHCQRHPVRRIPQPPAIIFKGQGWYSTDARATVTNAPPSPIPAPPLGAAPKPPAPARTLRGRPSCRGSC